jgi:hypothetical protein
MRNLPKPWNLRRSFGSQPVVCVGRSTCPKAGIPARVIPAIPSRSTLHGLGDVFWRLGDLATWRLAYLTPATAQAFSPPSTPRSGISPPLSRPGLARPSKAKQLFERLLRCYRAAQSSSIPSFPLKIARNYHTAANSFSIFVNVMIPVQNATHSFKKFGFKDESIVPRILRQFRFPIIDKTFLCNA